ncbi:MAG: family 43 glycosylhydrolase [Ruminococcus sp.]|nr:family 43 glycosylhydrolase [Ruminococcus sp.]
MTFFKRAAAGALASALVFLSADAFPQKIGGLAPMVSSAASTFNNPVIWSDVPDTDVIRVGDTYYMVSTTMFFSPGAPIMKSKDLVSWEMCNYIYDTLADGDVQNLTNGKNDYAHGQWATSLRYHNGTYYAFFGSYGTGKSYIYKTDDIENGTWTRSELNGMYHDASLLFDDDGRNYLVYGTGEIKIKELNSDMTGFKQGGADKTLFKTGIEGYVPGEGSHIQKIGDYYYIFIIAWPSGSVRTEYCYRSKDLLGSYESKVVLSSGVGSYGSGAAQGGIVDTPDGKWYGMVFQDHGAVGRIPVLVPVDWQNDWPIMGVNGKAPVTFTMDTDQTGTSLAGDDDFSYTSNDLALEWQWNHNPDDTAWSVTERDGWLRLHNKSIASNILNARNTLTMRTEGPACSSYIKLDTAGMKPGDRAGLSAFQLKFGNIGVYVTDSGAKKIYMATNSGDSVDQSSEKIQAEADLSGDEVYLKADFTFSSVGSDMSASNNIDKANFYYSYDGSNWTKLGSELSMSYDLKLFTGYRSAIYSYPTKSTGGYADIDFFEYDRTAWNGADGDVSVNGKGGQSVEPDEEGWYFHDTFESGTDSWSGRFAASVSSSSDTSYAGSKALLVEGRSESYDGGKRALSSKAFKAGESYSFSADVTYTAGSDNTDFKLTLEYTDAEGETRYDQIAAGTCPKGEWLQLSNDSYTIPEGATGLSIYIETTDKTKGDFYVDEVFGGVAGSHAEGPGQPKVRRELPGDIDCDGRISVFDVIMGRDGIVNGISDSLSAKNADADKSGEFDMNDLVLIQQFVLGKISEFPDNSPPPPPSNYDYDPAIQYRTAPGDYSNSCSQAGTVTKEYYNGINGDKALNVYTPYGYDPSKKYNVFYLMHGGGENENTAFAENKLPNILDHMIMNGELEPLIVVTPTFNGCPAPDGNMGAGTVWDELRQSIIPFVEGKYSTYADSTSLSDLKASRYHRAYGGFSMGGGSTWNVFINDLDICAYFMPLSGHCWSGLTGLQNAIDGGGYKQNEYFIFAATGDGDIAYNNMLGLVGPMKQDTAHFTYTSDFSQGNFYFLVGPGETHWWGPIRNYIYNGLPTFFHEGQ